MSTIILFVLLVRRFPLCVNLTALIKISISILSLTLHLFLFLAELIDEILDVLMELIMNEESIDILTSMQIEEGTESN